MMATRVPTLLLLLAATAACQGRELLALPWCTTTTMPVSELCGGEQPDVSASFLWVVVWVGGMRAASALALAVELRVVWVGDS